MASDPSPSEAPSGEMHRQESERPSDGQGWQPGHLDAGLASMSRRTLQYEQQIKDLEAKLTVDMSNSRAIHNLLQEVLSGIQQNQRRADHALDSTVPHIEHSLDEDLAALQELEEHLPQVGQQVLDIKHVYDRGRDKASSNPASNSLAEVFVPDMRPNR